MGIKFYYYQSKNKHTYEQYNITNGLAGMKLSGSSAIKCSLYTWSACVHTQSEIRMATYDNLHLNYVRFEVFMAVCVQTVVSWVMTPI
jgi:hypothetical protein